jgi:hypothetical protein
VHRARESQRWRGARSTPLAGAIDPKRFAAGELADRRGACANQQREGDDGEGL